MLELTGFFFLNALLLIISLDTHFTDFFDLEALILLPESLQSFMFWCDLLVFYMCSICFELTTDLCYNSPCFFTVFSFFSGSHLLHDGQQVEHALRLRLIYF